MIGIAIKERNRREILYLFSTLAATGLGWYLGKKIPLEALVLSDEKEKVPTSLLPQLQFLETPPPSTKTPVVEKEERVLAKQENSLTVKERENLKRKIEVFNQGPIELNLKEIDRFLDDQEIRETVAVKIIWQPQEWFNEWALFPNKTGALYPSTTSRIVHLREEGKIVFFPNADLLAFSPGEGWHVVFAHELLRGVYDIKSGGTYFGGILRGPVWEQDNLVAKQYQFVAAN